jgi:ribosomal protein S25
LAGESGEKSSKASNTCDNSYSSSSGFSVEERILKVIDESELELAPHEIARKIHANRSSVRVILRKLLDRGFVLQPYPGTYCNKITYGMRFVPLCVHNISLWSKVCQDVKHWEVDEVVGGVKIHVCFGSERRKISGYIACDVGGMSHDACLFAVHRWFDIAEHRLGWELNDLTLTTFEVNKDYSGVRIDGVQCITKKDLYGMIERTYQKEENLVRKEWKVSGSMSINKFEEALRKGVADNDRVQASFELKEEVKRTTEAVKFSNSRLLEIGRMQEAFCKAKVADVDKVKNIEKEVAALRGDIGKLTSVLSQLFDAEGGQGQASKGSGSGDGGKGYVT